MIEAHVDAYWIRDRKFTQFPPAMRRYVKKLYDEFGDESGYGIQLTSEPAAMDKGLLQEIYALREGRVSEWLKSDTKADKAEEAAVGDVVLVSEPTLSQHAAEERSVIDDIRRPIAMGTAPRTVELGVVHDTGKGGGAGEASSTKIADVVKENDDNSIQKVHVQQVPTTKG